MKTIIEQIIEGNIFTTICAHDKDHGCLVVWSSGAEEQLEGIVKSQINGSTSDGYHTFDELYEHRCLLFLALMKTRPHYSWISKMHSDGTSIEGWFIAGMYMNDDEENQVTYHMPLRLWDLATITRCPVLQKARPFDGHTSKDVSNRLTNWICPQ